MALSTPSRARASHVTPGVQAAGSRYHGATRRKDSNRERVYAPTLLGASKWTPIGGLADVQRLTDAVIVVPKGGVMSKLRAKEQDDEASTSLRKERRLSYSRAKGVTSGRESVPLAATAAGIAASETSSAVNQSDGAESAVPRVGAVVFTTNDSTAPKSGAFSTSFVDTASGDPQSHSLNAPRNRGIGGKLVNRRRRKKGKLSIRRSTHLTSGLSSSSSVQDQSYTEASGPAALEDLSVRGDHKSMSIAVHRRVFHRKRKDETSHTTRRPRRKKPRMLTSVEVKDNSNRSSEMTSKLQESVTTSLGRDSSSSEAKHETRSSVLARTSTIGSNINFTKTKLIPGDDSLATSTLTNEYSTSSRKANVAPRRGIDSVPLDEVGNNSVQPGNATTGNTLNRRKEMSHEQNTGSPEISGFHDLTKHSAVVSTTKLYATKSEKPELLHHEPSKPPPELVSTVVLIRAEPAARTSRTNAPGMTKNDSLAPEEEKFIDFNINHNDSLEHTHAESSTKHSLQDGQNGSGFLQSSPNVNVISPVAVVNLKQNSSSKTLVSVSTPHSFRNSETSNASDFTSRKQNFTHEDAKFSGNGSASSSGITAERNGAMRTSPHIQNSIATASSDVPKARHAATASNRDTLRTEGKQGVHIAAKTSIKPGENVFDSDGGNLLEMEVNFLTRHNRTQNASVSTRREESVSTSTHGGSTDSAIQPSTRRPTSSRVSNPPAGGGEWFRNGGVQAHSTAGKLAAAVIPSSSAVPNARGSEKDSRRGLEADDGDDDDDEDDDEDDDDDEQDDTSSKSQGRAERQPKGPSIVIELKAASAKARRRSGASKATPVLTEQRRAETVSESPKLYVPGRSSGSKRRKNANGMLRLDLSEVITAGLTSDVQSDQPAPLANNPEATKVPPPAPLNSADMLVAQDSHTDTATASQSHALSESTAPANASRDQPGVKLNSPLNKSDEASVWRTIIHPKSGAATAMTAVAGLGVENYYDDSKNDTSVRNADISEGRSEPKFENRRIAGEISSSTRKPGGKADVFQTEYYYDEPPASKAELSIPADVTEPGYGNAPEQEAIDDLFF